MKSIPKFLVLPGYVTSKNDNDEHYISYNQLIRLYGLNPEHCLEIRKKQTKIEKSINYIVLRPDYEGNYSLPKQIHNTIENIKLATKYHTEQECMTDFNTLPLIDRLLIAFKGFSL